MGLRGAAEPKPRFGFGGGVTPPQTQTEVWGYLEIAGHEGPFTLTAVADRIDRRAEGLHVETMR